MVRTADWRMLAIAFVALILVACGGGGGGSTGGSSGGTTGGISVSVSPGAPHVGPGAIINFSATVSGTSNQAVTWSAVTGVVTQSGVYTAPSTGGTYRVRATSDADPSKFREAVVTVTAGTLTINVTPANPQIGVREQIDFVATVLHATNTSVTWTATGGVIDANGHYTAPAAPGNYSIRATSVQDPSKWAISQARVSAIAISVNPSAMGMGPGETVQFTANVTGPMDKRVTWSADAGSITSTGLFTAPALPGTYSVTATSVVDPTVSRSAVVVVGDPTLYFTEDFETPPTGARLPPWVSYEWSETPSGRRIAGVFSGNSATPEARMALTNLPAHRAIRVSFDLYVAGDWRNDKIRLAVDGSVWNSLGFSCTSSVSQSFPDGGPNPPGTGSFESNVLGYHYEGGVIPVLDNTYRIAVSFPHQNSNATIDWLSILSRPPTNQFWGIDNVRIDLYN